jgi:hypothetical protein
MGGMMTDQTLKEQRQQYRKWYLMTQTPVPDYLKEENHVCDPGSGKLDLENCPACREIYKKKLEQENLGKYR